jgi:hypothetical protein
LIWSIWDCAREFQVLLKFEKTWNFVLDLLCFREYDSAYTIAVEVAPEMLPVVRQQRAATLAQTGHHTEAEKEFLAAGQADQAVQM